MEISSKKFSDRLREKEYNGSGGYVNVYVVASKVKQ
jgi:hypothetical protein